MTTAGSNLGPAQVELSYEIGGAEVKGVATSRIIAGMTVCYREAGGRCDDC
jgi:hypothetical protein